MKNTNPVIKSASEYVFNLFKDKLSGDHTYHSYEHTLDTVRACKKLATAYNLTSRDYEILILAAWFHDTGYTEIYQDHEQRGVEIMKSYLEGQYKLEDLAEIENLILSTKHEHIPDGTLQEILHDADLINVGKRKFNRRADLLRIEWEKIIDKKFSNIDWASIQLEFLLKTTFKTEEAIKLFGPQRDENIRKQHEIVEALKGEETKERLKAEKKVEEKPKKEGRGIETLYRSVYSYHTNLTSIADNKAHIMININTIIISLVITLFGSGYTFASQEAFSSIRFVFPMALLLITSLLSVVFAILSARPSVTSKQKYELSNKTSSVLFFGNFAQLQLTDFIGRIKQLKEDNNELYDSMSIDVYHLGTVLVKKYKLLRWSYNIFMWGIVLCAVGFIVIVIISARGRA